MPGREFWGLHAALVASAGVLLLGCRSRSATCWRRTRRSGRRPEGIKIFGLSWLNRGLELVHEGVTGSHIARSTQARRWPLLLCLGLVPWLAPAGAGPAAGPPTWQLTARVVAVGLPGVAGVRQVGRFHAGGPFTANPEFLLQTDAGACSTRSA